MEATKPDNQLMFGLNMIKKALAYPEVFEDHPKAEFIAIYTQKAKLAGEDNECMKKIKTLIWLIFWYLPSYIHQTIFIRGSGSDNLINLK